MPERSDPTVPDPTRPGPDGPEPNEPGAPDVTWRDQRSEAARLHAEQLQHRRTEESALAAAMIADFVQEARARGIPPVRLRARGYGGATRYRTSTLGWYLRRNESVGVGLDGSFYLLAVPGGLRARVAGATLVPSDPPLVLGRGARDGESIDLADAIAIALGDIPR